MIGRPLHIKRSQQIIGMQSVMICFAIELIYGIYKTCILIDWCFIHVSLSAQNGIFVKTFFCFYFILDWLQMNPAGASI